MHMHRVKVVMPFLQLFVSNILIDLVDAVFNYRETIINEYVTPLYYKLEIDLFNYIGQNSAFGGESRITIHIEKNIQILNFHSFVSIEEVTLHKINPNNVTIKEPNVRNHLVATYKPGKVHHFWDRGLVSLFFNETIECGYYVIDIKFWEGFTTNTENDGFLVTSYENLGRELQWMVVTQTQVRGPQAVFPCWDNPSFKTVFDVSVHHPKTYSALSNLKKDKFVYDESDMMWTNFRSTSLISVHCIDIVVLPTIYSDFTPVYVNNNVTMWVPQNSILPNPEFDFALKITKNVTKYLKEQNLVDQCKVAKTIYFAVRKFSTAVIATPSFVLYREENITVFDQKYRKKREKEINVARLLAQQITYQWILRSTNPLYFSQLKDVSNFLAMYILQKVFSKFEVQYWPIKTEYDDEYYSNALYTSDILNLDDLMKFIIITRTNTFCDSYEEELSVKSLFDLRYN